ncbi:MAG: methionine biosynthesis protein MetW [Spirochaetales bacterium]|nr:methionine biosynthesis protein MetW [Spirochaetales bacterium]RKX86502.1 MAG: methionine biosynthesis protein MetW [Spirochaetota bacterium]
MYSLKRPHLNYKIITEIIEEGSSVLDLGCGDGELLYRLKKQKGISGRGVEIEERMIMECISKGISVFQGNLDEGLKDYGTNSYDYVILNQTLQVTHKPVLVLKEMLRVGRKAIISFPNFGQLKLRFQLLFKGRMPVTKDLPYQWYNTPNIHLCTRKDFLVLCRENNIRIIEEIDIREGYRINSIFANSRSSEVIFILEKYV